MGYRIESRGADGDRGFPRGRALTLNLNSQAKNFEDPKIPNPKPHKKKKRAHGAGSKDESPELLILKWALRCLADPGGADADLVVADNDLAALGPWQNNS